MSIVSGTVGAVMGSEATEDAAQASRQATTDAAAMQVAMQEEALTSQQEMMSPYGKVGAQGLAQLYGQDVEYIDQTMPKATLSEVKAAGLDPNKTWYKNAQGQLQSDNIIRYKGTGQEFNLMRDPYTGQIMQMPSYDAEYTKRLANYEEDPAVKAQRALDAKRLAQLEQQRVGYSTPGASAARAAELNQKYDVVGYDKYKSTLSDRYKALQGEFAAKRAMTADEYDRLTQKMNLGLGVTKQLGSAGQNFANQAGQAVGQAGQAASQAASQAGAAQANLWSGLGAASANTAATGLRLYDYGKTAGWWGGSGAAATGTGAAGTGATTLEAGEVAAMIA